MSYLEMNVPDGWESNKLGAVCKIKKGIQFNRIELSDAGMYPCINGGITPSGYSDLWNTEAETITISEGGNSCGFVNYLTSKFWSGGHCYSLLDLKKGLDKGFLYQALKGRESLIMDLRVGSGLPNIQQKAIKEFELLVPKSAAEQIQIANILSKVDEAISQTEQLIDKYHRLKTGLMQDLLTKGIDAHGNIRSEETHAFKDSPLGRIPVEWKIDWLGNISKITTGGKDTQDRDDNGIYPFYVRSQTVERINSFSFDGEGILTAGDGVGVGKVFHYVNGKFDFHQRVYLIHNFADEISGEFVFLYFKEHFIKRVDMHSAKNTVDSVRLHMISEMDIPIMDFEEQLKIVRAMNSIDDTLNSSSNELNKLQSLKTGLMQDLLSGKVRVGQLIRETVAV